ncbi:MAG TPA: phosphopantetheine-binding protein [Aquabacterium sp.]|nr:phosphopantetheine-binding protein [Aquabacterium sp.]
MNLETDAIEAALKARIVAIADTLGADASDLAPDELIPATGLIDSAGLLELIAWFEATYCFKIPVDELTIDNLGTLTSMAAYLRRRKGVA